MDAVLAIGETMVLVTPEAAQPLEQATGFRLDIGGAESNVASHLVRAGVPAAWAGAVGDDPLGRRILATLAARGVDVSLATVDPDAPTGVYFKDPGPAGTRVHYYRRGSAASRLGPDFADRLPLATVPLVHLSGITAALSSSCRALLDEVIGRRAGRPVSFDVNYRPGLWSAAEAGPVLLDLARRCDLVFVGRDEAEALWGTSSAEHVRALLGPGRRLVVKDGATGAHAFHSGQNVYAPARPSSGVADHHVFVPAQRVEVVEPVGAGDAFAAGYLAAELAGDAPGLALVRGHRCAAAALTTTADY